MTTPGEPLAVRGPRSRGTFSYSGDPRTTALDAVRFLTGDTHPEAFFLNDAEIAYLIDMATQNVTDESATIPAAAGAAAEAIAAELSREVSYSADGVSVSADSLASKFYQVAEKIRTLSRRTDVTAAPDVGGILVSEVYDWSIRPLVWAVGMHDNYRAGQQDFGGAFMPPGAGIDWSSSGGYAIGAIAAELTTEAIQTQQITGTAAAP
jgi:hypothetical protein